MPYTEQHRQYLEAMGLVPWVQRGGCVATDVAASVENAGDCSVLLVFNAISTQRHDELSEQENRLLLDMFNAIELQEASVARRSVSMDASTDVSECVRPFITPNVKVILVVVNDSCQVATDEEAASRLATSGLEVPVWQLPHPGWIRQEPALKRRAWNVLKAVRDKLPDPVSA